MNDAGGMRPHGQAADDPPAAPFERPYDRLAALPRAVWLPALVTAVGTRERRLDEARAWLDDLVAARLPDAALDFGAADAAAPLRAIVGELALPALACGVPALAEQVLRTLLWHLDRLNDLQPRRTRAEAIAQVVAEFRAAWRIDTAGLEDELALLRELADGASLQWDLLAGQLKSREWQQARRAAERLERLPELVALLDHLGRASRRRRPAPATPRAGGR